MYRTILASWLAIACAQPVMATPNLRSLLETPDIGQLAVSPDGERIAFRTDYANIERNTYESRWYVLPVAGRGAPISLGQGGTPVRDYAGIPLTEPPIWDPNGKWIYFRALWAGRIGVWRAATDGNRSEPLVTESADVLEVKLSDDGQSLIYSLGPDEAVKDEWEQDEAEHGILIDETIAASQGLFRSALTHDRPTTQRLTGNWAARGTLWENYPRRMKAVNLMSLKTAEVSDEGRKVAGISGDVWTISSPFGPGHIEVRRFGDHSDLRHPPFQSITYVEGPETSRVSPWCAKADCQNKQVSSVVWLDPQSIAVTVTDYTRGLAQTLYEWNVVTGTWRHWMNGTGLLSGGRLSVRYLSAPCAVAKSSLICVEAHANQPPRLVRIDRGQTRVTPLFEPGKGEAQVRAQAQALTWTSAGGRLYTGTYFPATGRKTPLFITYYQCPGFIRGGFGDEWPLSAMAAEGIASLCVNRPFGSPLDPEQRYGQGLDAVVSAIDFLAERGDIDPERVGLGGLSLGSEVTYWTLMHTDRIAAASVSSPALTPLSHELRKLQGVNYRDELRRTWGLGDVAETPDVWKRLAPSLNLDRMKTPLLMQMPEQEYLHALDYYVAMREQHLPTELYAFPYAPHQKVQPRQKLAVYTRNLDWFRFWLLDTQDDLPQKADQYNRWRGLRPDRDDAAKP